MARWSGWIFRSPNNGAIPYGIFLWHFYVFVYKFAGLFKKSIARASTMLTLVLSRRVLGEHLECFIIITLLSVYYSKSSVFATRVFWRTESDFHSKFSTLNIERGLRPPRGAAVVNRI